MKSIFKNDFYLHSYNINSCVCISISLFLSMYHPVYPSIHPFVHLCFSMSIIISIIYYLSDLSSLSIIYLYHLIYKIPNRELSFVTIFLAYLLSFFFDSCILSLQVYLVLNYIHLDVLAQFDHLCLEIGTFCTFILHHNIYLGSYLPDTFLLLICFSFFLLPRLLPFVLTASVQVLYSFAVPLVSASEILTWTPKLILWLPLFLLLFCFFGFGEILLFCYFMNTFKRCFYVYPAALVVSVRVAWGI